MRLPAHVHVTQTARIVSFEDSSGTVLREIATVPAEADTFAPAPGARHQRGVWNGAALEVSRPGPGGADVVESWSLADSGATLMSTISFPGGGDTPARTVRRVYRRASQP